MLYRFLRSLLAIAINFTLTRRSKQACKMNLRPYPQFRPIDIQDKPLFDEAFAAKPPAISEFTFTNLYAWRHIYKLSAATLDGLIILRSEAGAAGAAPEFFEPIGEGDVKSAISKIIDDTGGEFIRLPEETVALFRDDRSFGRLRRPQDDNSRAPLRVPYNIVPDPDNDDYLYRTEDLAKLVGKKYDGKRNLIKKFKSAYEYEYIKLNAANAKSALDFEDAWCQIKDCDSVRGLYNEREAVREMLANFAGFALTGGAIKVEGAIRAVAVGERLNKDTLVMHILKADPNIAGLYQAMMHEFVVTEASGFEFINLEQDLGVEGLRKSKLSYHPVAMVKKYIIK